MRRVLAVLGVLFLAGCAAMRALTGAPPVYAVFFDGPEMTLTANGRVIVDDAAKDAREHPLMYVQITGPSTKSAKGYDPALAEARMRIVEQTLVADGIPAERQFRTEPTPDMLMNDPTGRQRVEIRIVAARPASS